MEVINTGTELLLGNVINSHLAFFGQELFKLGLRVQRQVCVPDGPEIRTALVEAFGRTEAVLVTGGLGPTTDDITREITAELAGVELRKDPAVAEAIRERFARRGFKMSERVMRQAQVPEGATVLPNANGTAPGLYLPAEGNRPHLFLLPGPPRELRPMFMEQVAPILKGLAKNEKPIVARTFRVIGLGESAVEEMIGAAVLAIPGIELGYCARPGEVDVRLIGSAGAVGRGEGIVLEKLGEQIATQDDRSLAEVIVEMLAEKKLSVAVTESCTGGHIANAITDVPGASEVFREGFITYSNEAKSRALGIPAELIAAHGAVSEEVAVAMAAGARRVTGADFAVSSTGIAGPGGGTAEKPVGTVYIGIASGEGVEAKKCFFPTDRETFKSLVSQTALELIRKKMKEFNAF